MFHNGMSSSTIVFLIDFTYVLVTDWENELRFGN